MAENVFPKWHPGEVIRERKSGKPFLVLHVYKNVATILSDMTESMPVAIVLLPAKYGEFATDKQMELEGKEDFLGEIKNEKWRYSPTEFL